MSKPEPSNIVVFSTVQERKEALQMAHSLVEKHLAACVNILPVSSIYRWKGEVVEDKEILLIVKSSTRVVKDIIDCIKKLSSYEVPEIIVLPIIDGSPEYLEWLDNSVVKP